MRVSRLKKLALDEITPSLLGILLSTNNCNFDEEEGELCVFYFSLFITVIVF